VRCSVWRQAAESVAESLQRGMRVIAQGRLRQRSFETREGEKRTVVELEVDEIGPSMRFATAKVTKTQRSGGGGGGYGAGSPSGAPVGTDPWATQGARAPQGGGNDPWTNQGGGAAEEPPCGSTTCHSAHAARVGTSHIRPHPGPPRPAR